MSDTPRRSWLREPLLHFLVAGGLLFVLYAFVAQDQEVEVRTRVHVDARVISDLERQWTAVWARPPTEVELRRMIDEFIREDVLYREALALDLDQGDAILRRRMIQKMRFLAEDVSQLAPPTEDEIASYFTRNADRYREPGRVTFAHAFFNPDTRGDALREDIDAARRRLRASDPTTTDEEGDRFLPGYVFEDASRETITAQFGAEFAQEVLALPVGEWSGPIVSAYGPHLVRIRARTAGRMPALSAVRDVVIRDLLESRSAATDDALFDEMLARYDVVVDEEAVERAVTGGAGGDE